MGGRYHVGLSESEHLLDQDDNERVRQRAAQATGRVADRGGHFAERCLALALGDPSPAVRRAAGRSFADLASQRELETFAERLAERKSRKAAVDLSLEHALVPARGANFWQKVALVPT